MHWGDGKQPCVRGGSSHLAGQPECMAVHQAAGSIMLYLVRVQCSLETEAGFYVLRGRSCDQEMVCWPGGRGARVGVKVGGGRWSSFGLILCTQGQAGVDVGQIASE